MIEINLLPEELKTMPKKAKVNISNIIEARYLKLIVPFVVGVIILLHMILGALMFFRGKNLGSLNAKWVKLSSQRKDLEEFKKEYSLLTQDLDFIKKVSQQRLSWSEKLYILSAALPQGVWFNQMTLGPRDVSLSCSVLASGKDDLGAINAFIDALKKDNSFANDFSSMDLGAITKKTLGNYEVTDFSLTLVLKAKQ